MTVGGSQLRYDAGKRLYKVGSTCLLYDGQDLIAETNCSDTVLNRYVHGPNVDDPVVWYAGSGTGSKRYYTEDRQGSIIDLTDGSGSAYPINSYDEYGVPAATNVGRFQFTVQIWLAEAGLYYYKERFYHPQLGRFMQTDPIGYKDGMNWYAYVGNDPMNFIDPTGMKYQCTSTNDGPVKCVEVPGDDSEDKPGSNGARGSGDSGSPGSSSPSGSHPYRDGGNDFFKDLFRAQYQYESLQGVYGEAEQQYARMADTAITGAAYLYYTNSTFRNEAHDAALNSVLNNKTYFLGRQVAQALTVTAILRSSSAGWQTKATLWTGSTGSFTSVGGYGRALNLIDQGVDDELSLMSGMLFGAY